MEKILLDVKVRDVKVSPNYLRKQRQIPAVFYGNKQDSVALQVDYQTFRKAYERAGGNQVIELNIEGKKQPVLVHEVQYNPLTDNFDHIDFVHVNMNVAVKANIPVVVTGTAPAVKNLGGILTTLRHELEVKCLPADLPQNIEVDVNGLEQLHSSVHLRDLKLPAGVQLTGNPDDVVVTISVVKEEVESTTTMEQAVAESAAASGSPAPAADAAAPAPEKKE
ncbi:MAG: 50S ribosomal protein L25 [Candidatus Gracilibacteria bacterium]